MFPIFAGSNAASTGYNLTRSLRLRRSATAYLNRTMTTPTDGKMWTYSVWRKLGDVGAAFDILLTARPGASAGSMQIVNGVLRWYGNVTNAYDVISTQTWRDPSAWYHYIFVYDSTQATASNRLKYYVNGAQGTFSSATYPSLNLVSPDFNSANVCQFGADVNNGRYSDGQYAEANFIDGQALTPSSFGSTNALTGVWQPAAYTGSYGTNGFYLPFTDNSALTTASNVGLGKDFSGNGNYWVTNNISITAGVTYDSMTDVPTLTSATAANFAVLNPLQNPNGTIVTYSGANLNYSYSSGTANKMTVLSTIGITSGKFYCEFTEGSSVNSFVGINAGLVSGGGANGTYYAATGGGINGSSAATYSGTSLSTATGNIVGLAFDATALTLAIYKNNTLQGTFSGIESGKTWFMMIAPYTGASAGDGILNFGQRPFSYTAPTGFVALNTYNLPDSTIVKGNTVMDATLYTGTGASLSVTNTASFKPDLVWVKSRSAATSHKLTDSVRGVTIGLVSNTTAAETTDTQGLTAFGSAGFTVGTNTDYNNLAATYVGWQWQAGQGSTSSNTNGNVTSTVSVNASAGFSVVTYTVTSTASMTIGHGLGVAPQLIIEKRRDAAANWDVYTAATGNTGRLQLNSTAAFDVQAGVWNNTTPTSTVFSQQGNGTWHAIGATCVAYCWTPIAGFSAFGSYTGNGSADGPFVYTGFRPKWVMVKTSSVVGNWFILDAARNAYNVANTRLAADASASDDTNVAYSIDFLSNGFKLRSSSNVNVSGTYIYLAFAENPLKYALAR